MDPFLSLIVWCIFLYLIVRNLIEAGADKHLYIVEHWNGRDEIIFQYYLKYRNAEKRKAEIISNFTKLGFEIKHINENSTKIINKTTLTEQTLTIRKEKLLD